MNRRMLREHCFKILFCTDFYAGEDKTEQISAYFEQPQEETDTQTGEEVVHRVNLTTEEEKEVEERAKRCLSKLAEIDDMLKTKVEGWSFERIGKVEKAILRLACFEIEYADEVPSQVAINEAVELAKKFGGNDSSSFVNGILAKLV